MGGFQPERRQGFGARAAAAVRSGAYEIVALLTTVGTGKEPDARSDVELVALGKQGVENQAQFGEKLLLVQPAVQGEEFPGGVQYCTVEAASQDSMPQMMTASTSSSWRSMAL